jgi:hypothetical protein
METLAQGADVGQVVMVGLGPTIQPSVCGWLDPRAKPEDDICCEVRRTSEVGH